MAQFHFTALTDRETAVEGRLEAISLEQAKQMIKDRGLRIVSLESAETPADAQRARLSQAQSTEIVEQIVNLSETSLPLVEGLRAAARESQSRSVSRTLVGISNDIERGVPLSDAIESEAVGFPRFLRGLVAAASRTEQLAATLDECLALQREKQHVWRTLAMSLLYPVILLVTVAGMMFFMFVFVVQDFKTLFAEFGPELPGVTIALFRISDMGESLTQGASRFTPLSVILAIGVFAILFRVAVGKANCRWLLGTVPIIGPLWIWSSAATFSKILGILLNHEIPLPDALALAGQSVGDANIQTECDRLSQGVATGSRLSDLVASSFRLPQSMVPFVRTGEEQGELPDALQTASNLFFERLRLRASLLRTVSPPVIFVLVTLTIAVTVIGLLLPLFDLIQGLM